MSNITKLGLVGFGTSGNIFFENCIHTASVKLQYIVDEKLPKSSYYGAKVVNIQDLIADNNITHVIISQPNYPSTIDIIKSGKHVLCEFPISDDLSIVARSYKAAKKKNVSILINNPYLFDQKLIEFRGKLSEINQIVIINRINKSDLNLCNFYLYNLQYTNFLAGSLPDSITITHSTSATEFSTTTLTYNGGKTIVNIILGRGSRFNHQVEIYGPAGGFRSESPIATSSGGTVEYHMVYEDALLHSLKNFITDDTCSDLGEYKQIHQFYEQYKKRVND